MRIHDLPLKNSLLCYDVVKTFKKHKLLIYMKTTPYFQDMQALLKQLHYGWQISIHHFDMNIFRKFVDLNKYP